MNQILLTCANVKKKSSSDFGKSNIKLNTVITDSAQKSKVQRKHTKQKQIKHKHLEKYLVRFQLLILLYK